MPAIFFENSIGWAQYKLLGGWKNLLSTSIGYAILGALVIYAMVKGVREPPQQTFSAFIEFFLVIQVISLLLYGTMRVGGAVRADVNAKLIESHRLMPTPPFTAVLGYLFGSTAQALSLFVVTFVLGAACVVGAGMRMQSWIFSNAVLLLFSVFVWTIVLFFSFRSGGIALGFIIGLVFLTVSSGAPFALLPAINVLLSPMISTTIFDMRTGITLDPAFMAAAIAQIAIGAIYLTAAARRYSRDDSLTFDSTLSLLLLVIWTLVCVLSVRWHDLFTMRLRGMVGWRYEEIATVASISSVLLLGILPISSSVRVQVLPPHKRATNFGLHIPPSLAVLATTAAASGAIQCVQREYRPPWSDVRTLIVAFAFLTSTRYMLGVAHRFKAGPRRSMLVWLIVTWLLPVFAEAVRSAAIADPNKPDRMSQISMISPPGELYQIWTHNPYVHTDGFQGLATQCAIAAGAALLYYSSRPRYSGGERREGVQSSSSSC
jgi:hypothetical protein